MPIDLSLVVGSDGLVHPHAGPSPLTFSDGGNGPLISAVGPDGQVMSVRYPSALPSPTLDGPTATYADVLPDVDLVVSATATGGFSEVFRVETADAGTNPALKDVALEVTTPGMSMTVDPTTNALTATDTSGNVQFKAPTPTMWDSSTPAGVATPDPQDAPPVSTDPTQSDATGPGVQADTAAMPTSLTTAPSGAPANTQTVNVHPDLSMLADPTTVYPVYIDPYYAPYKADHLHFTWVQQGCPTTSNLDSTARYPGAGLNGYSGCVGIERTFYEMDTSALAGATIGSASLATSVNYSAQYCPGNAWNFSAQLSNPITSATTWNNQPGVDSSFGANTQSVSHCQGQGTVPVSFDVTSAIKAAAAGSWTNATFRLVGDEGNSSGWKRFDNAPVLNVTFDRAPNTPTNLSLTPTPVNGYLGRGNAVSGLTMHAVVSTIVNGQSVRGVFTLTDTTVNKVVYANITPYFTQSGAVSATAPSSVLTDGHTLAWDVHANDGILDGPTAYGSNVTLDTTPPSVTNVSSATFPAVGTAAPNGSAVPVAGKTSGSVTIGVSDAGSGVARIDWQLGGTLPTGAAPATVAGHGGSVTSFSSNSAGITISPTDWGTNTLLVRAVDRAGNTSQTSSYTFYVASDPTKNPNGGRLTGITGSYDLATIVPGVGAEKGCNVLQIDPLSQSDPNAASGALTATATATAPFKAAGCADAPTATPNNGGLASWAGAKIAHDSNFGSGAGQYDDLFVWQNGVLRAYINQLGTSHWGYYSQGQSSNIARPLTGGTTAKDWSDLLDLTAPGDVDGGGVPDLVTIEHNATTNQNQLIQYSGTLQTALTNPVDITSDVSSLGGSAFLGHVDLMSPGPIPNGTSTSIWFRDRTTGSIYSLATAPTGPDTSAFTSAPVQQAPAGTFPVNLYPDITMANYLNQGGTTTSNWVPELITTSTAGVLARQALTSTTGHRTLPITQPGSLGATSVEHTDNSSLSTTLPSAPSDYVPLAQPYRLVDTRSGYADLDTLTTLHGGVTQSVSALTDLTKTSKFNFTAPNTTVTAVAVNAVLVNANQQTWVRLGDDTSAGTGVNGIAAIDPTSTINTNTGDIASGFTTVRLDQTGSFKVVLGGGSSTTADLLIDIVGYYTSSLPGDGTTPSFTTTTSSPAGSPSTFVATPVTRVCDSRSVTANGCAPLQAGKAVTLNLSGQTGVAGATAVAVNITSVNFPADAAISAWNPSQQQPATSVINPLAGQNVSTSTVIALDGSGLVNFQSGVSGNFVLDVMGFYHPDDPTSTAPAGSTRYVAIPPARIFRTTTGLNNAGTTTPLNPGQPFAVTLASATDNLGNSVTPASPSGAPTMCSAVIDLSAFNQQSSGWVGTVPLGSNSTPVGINFDGNSAKSNTVIARTTNGNIELRNSTAAPTDALIDITGYFIPVQGGACS